MVINNISVSIASFVIMRYTTYVVHLIKVKLINTELVCFISCREWDKIYFTRFYERKEEIIKEEDHINAGEINSEDNSWSSNRAIRLSHVPSGHDNCMIIRFIILLVIKMMKLDKKENNNNWRRRRRNSGRRRKIRNFKWTRRINERKGLR
jgi:hypothetical protein